MNKPKQRASIQASAEWVSFLISSAIVAGILGAVGYLWVGERHQQPPTLKVVTHVETRQGEYYVPFTVTNVGGETAEAVQVVAELRVDGALVEWGDQRIDFLSRDEAAEGAFIFTRSPDSGDLTVRVASYKLP